MQRPRALGSRRDRESAPGTGVVSLVILGLVACGDPDPDTDLHPRRRGLATPIMVVAFDIGCDEPCETSWDERANFARAILEERLPDVILLQGSPGVPEIRELLPETREYVAAYGGSTELHYASNSPTFPASVVVTDPSVLDIYIDGQEWVSDRPHARGSTFPGETVSRYFEWANLTNPTTKWQWGLISGSTAGISEDNAARWLASHLGLEITNSRLAAVTVPYGRESAAYETMLEGRALPLTNAFDIAESVALDDALEESVQRDQLRYHVLLNQCPDWDPWYWRILSWEGISQPSGRPLVIVKVLTVQGNASVNG